MMWEPRRFLSAWPGNMARSGSALGIALALSILGTASAKSQPAGEPSREVIAAGNRLGLELYGRLSKTGPNVVLSPYSISAALTMATAGARGDTEKEMIAIFGSGLTAVNLADAQRQLAAALQRQSADGGTIANVANALHLARLGYMVRPAFRTLLADQYGAQIFEGSDLAAVNGWVKKNTNGRIDKILTQLDPNSVCILVNAIYFQGTWATRFDKRSTRAADFHLGSGEVVQVPTMHEQGNFQALHTPNYDAIRLPYQKSGVGMILIMPAQSTRLEQLEAGLDAQTATAIAADLLKASPAKIDLSLPKYKAETGADLIPALRLLGVKLAFDLERADFSGITDSARKEDRIAISQIQHRAYIDVNEDGTEAAAATAIGFAAGATQAQPTVLSIDRPFLFLIADEASGAILFIGRVADPRQAAAE